MPTDAEDIGYTIVVKALEAPLRQIAVNAGKDDGSVIVQKVKEGSKNHGYNAATDEFVADMLMAGIVDPVKVTRTTVQNAVSAAAMLITTEVIIADEPKEDKGPAPHDHGGMDMDY